MTRTLLALRRSAYVARQIVAPTGRHRPKRPLLLPDEPCTLTVGRRGVIDEAEMFRLLHDGTAEVLESAECPCCDRFTAHARQDDGWLRCWTCSTKSPAGAE